MMDRDLLGKRGRGLDHSMGSGGHGDEGIVVEVLEGHGRSVELSRF